MIGVEFVKFIIIGDNCWIGGMVVINFGVIFGNNVVVVFGVVVMKSFGSNLVIGGNFVWIIKMIDFDVF